MTINRRALLGSAAAASGLAAAGCAPFLTGTAPTPPAASDPSVVARLNAFMDSAWERTLDVSPETVTGFGLDQGPRAAAKSLLSVPTREEEARGRAIVREFRAELAAIDRSRLAGIDAIRYDTLAQNWDAVIATYDIPYGQGGWPNIYRVNQMGGAYSSTADFLDTQHTIETSADADAYVARVAMFADVLTAETERVQEDFALGVIPPDFILAKTIAQQEAMTAVTPGQTPLVASISRRTAEKGLSGDWSARVERLVAERVHPALAAQTAALKAVQPRAGHDASVARLPQGAQYYRNSLRYLTTTTLTPDEIHRIGLEQVAQLSAQADVLLKAQGFSQGTVAQRIRALGEDPQFIAPNTDAGKEALIARLNDQMQAMDARLPAAFGRLPKSRAEIRRVPPAIEQGAALGYYNGPSLDGSRPGIYWINLKDTADWPTWTLPTLTYHEASPGHHLQIALQQESPSAPRLMNTVFFSSYVEGWGLYAEQLADELGAYEDDALGRIGYLQSLMFRSARLVVDTGIHSKGWSREQGIQYMMEAYGDGEGAATSEVERYCAWPGQACTYKVGHNEWVRLRKKARAELGARFDVRGFHDAALETGGVPLTVLERVVDEWIASRRA
ncbi:MAG TPA: DUF885 family protein [Brevundimonas sp.]|jgi:uncharacterized protein (DUF885 family)|uniref:DUF885 domain-containing protein n=1 Tax=Brevundimonas sp. TaxID=1871086 RepID=UPI002DE8EE1F|nr:DUF885 family protein [Brevundimonas sp.]